MVKTTVKMKLCTRVAGTVKCKDEGYKAEFETGTVGPTSVDITYPT